MIPIAYGTKVGGKDKWDLIKIQSFYASNDTIKKIDKHIEWGKIFANYVSNKELVSRLYKKLIIQEHKDKNPIKK